MYVVTFYSYKGGVGRTMALANVAALLAQDGRRVLVVDFDLEAPGVPSYGPLASARGKRGLVDYVHDYLVSHAAPKAADYIVECPVEQGGSIWVMPAGDNALPTYSDRLASIDWGYLYEHQHGYELIDDLRQQWMNHPAAFDYVLVDSRTGNTDIAGICTRQLPDAVVTMFVPTRQNIVGLVPIVDLIRQESRERDHGIDLLFCPSNIPDLFDEDDILGRALRTASTSLHYGEPGELEPAVTEIHHWGNMELMEQPLVVHQRAQSKLAKEYAALRTAIIEQNVADREGGLSALQRMPKIYEAARAAKKGTAAKDIIDRTSEIARLHGSDGEIAILAARLFSMAGEYEQEERSLSDAIDADVQQASRAFVLRALARVKLNRRAEALEDVRSVLLSSNGTSFEFRPAVQLLRTVVDDPVEEALSIFRDTEVKLRARILLSHLIMQERRHHDLIADDLLAAAKRNDISPVQMEDVLNTAILALIGAGRFGEAIRIADALGPSDSVATLFNRTIATWGLTRRLPQDDFGILDERLGQDAEGDQNLHQCIALVRAVTGQRDAALREIEEAEDHIAPSSYAFSCWTYTQRSAEEFRADLREMRDLVAAGEVPKPPFLDGPAR